MSGTNATKPTRRLLATAGIDHKLLLSTTDAAFVLSISERTLDKLLQRGAVRCIHVGARKLIPRVAIEAYIAEQLQTQGAVTAGEV